MQYLKTTTSEQALGRTRSQWKTMAPCLPEDVTRRLWNVIGNDATHGYSLLEVPPGTEQFLTTEEQAALLPASDPDVQAVLTAPTDPRAQGTKWNPDDRGIGIALGSADFIASANSITEWNSVRTGVGKVDGKWYWEIVVLGGPAPPADKIYFGAAIGGTNMNNVFPGSFNNSAGIQADANHVRTWVEAVTETFGRFADVRDVIYSFALDVPAGHLWVARNDQWLAGGDPAQGLVPWVTGVTQPVFPCVGLRSTAGETVSVRIDSFFGRCKYEPPEGFRFLG